MTAKKIIALANTVRVGQRLISGAMRIAPTHWAAWLTPNAAPTVQCGEIRYDLQAVRELTLLEGIPCGESISG